MARSWCHSDARAGHRDTHFIISLILAVLALLGHFANIPYVTQYQFWLAIIGYVVLAAGVMMKGV